MIFIIISIVGGASWRVLLLPHVVILAVHMLFLENSTRILACIHIGILAIHKTSSWLRVITIEWAFKNICLRSTIQFILIEPCATLSKWRVRTVFVCVIILLIGLFAYPTDLWWNLIPNLRWDIAIIRTLRTPRLYVIHVFVSLIAFLISVRIIWTWFRPWNSIFDTIIAKIILLFLWLRRRRDHSVRNIIGADHIRIIVGGHICRRNHTLVLSWYLQRRSLLIIWVLLWRYYLCACSLRSCTILCNRILRHSLWRNWLMIETLFF